MDQIVLGAFRDELTKIAQDEVEELNYKTLQTPEGTFRLARDIPLLSRLPRDPEAARQKLIDVISTRDITPVLGYENVAIRRVGSPTPAEMGYEPTRLATPLPGESMFSTSWRRGRSHIHGIGPFYLAHRDKTAPMDPTFGYLTPRALKHFITEGVPSMVKRFTTERNTPLVEQVQQDVG